MALQDFYCAELGSQYVAGLTYMVRPMLTEEDTTLATLVLKWLAEKPPLIRIVEADPAGAVVGTGAVFDTRQSTKG